MAEPWLDLDVRIAIGGIVVHVCMTSEVRVVGVVGPSGGGKTTLLRVLAGVERRGVGTVKVFGSPWQDAHTFVPPWERGVGWVPQDAALFPHLDVRGNLLYAGAQRANSAGATDLGQVAALLGVSHLLDRAPRHLSGGERQRVALGRALLSGPRLLLLDEPFAALDRPLRARVSADLAAWCAERRLPVVLATHDERDLDVFSAGRWEIVDGVVRPSVG